eukprot:3294586-Prorocentrum_lima.AAC.1
MAAARTYRSARSSDGPACCLGRLRLGEEGIEWAVSRSSRTNSAQAETANQARLFSHISYACHVTTKGSLPHSRTQVRRTGGLRLHRALHYNIGFAGWIKCDYDAGAPKLLQHQ